MTIFRDLTLGIAATVAAVACGTFAAGLVTVQDFVRGTLDARTRSDAAMLAEQLAVLPSAQDAGAVLQSAFDAYGYHWVQLHDTQGELLFRASRAQSITDVPDWFEQLLPVEGSPVFQTIPAGPLAQGRLGLAPDELVARRTLWSGAQRLALLGLLGLAAAGLAAWATRRLLRHAIDGVAARARNWADNDEAPVAANGELAAIGAAFDDLRARAGARIAQHTRTIDALQEELEIDAVTRLPNRRRFLAALRAALAPAQDTAAADTPAPHGHVLMFRQRDLAAINRRMPRRLTDQWLRAVSERVLGLLETPGEPRMLARLNGSDFGVLLRGMEPAEALRLSERLRTELRGCRVPLDDAGNLCRWALTLTAYDASDEPARILARLDHGLMQSESAGAETIATALPRPLRPEGGEYFWKDALLTALDQHRFSLHTVRQTLADGTSLRHQASLALHDPVSGQTLPARTFIPPAIRLGLVADCDIQAVRLALDWLRTREGELAALISLASLGQPQFLPRMRHLLQDSADQARRLLLEIDAHGLIDHYADVRALCELAKETGVRIGLRRLTRQFGAMAHLHHLPLSYIRLDEDFVTGLGDSPGSKHLAASVANTARSLGIAVYAMAPDDPSLGHWLAGLDVVLLRQEETAQPGNAAAEPA